MRLQAFIITSSLHCATGGTQGFVHGRQIPLPTELHPQTSPLICNWHRPSDLTLPNQTLWPGIWDPVHPLPLNSQSPSPIPQPQDHQAEHVRSQPSVVDHYAVMARSGCLPGCSMSLAWHTARGLKCPLRGKRRHLKDAPASCGPVVVPASEGLSCLGVPLH